MRRLPALLLVVVFHSSLSGERLGYHEIRVDGQNKIVPWYSPDLGVSYDHVVRLVWKFWHQMETCPNGPVYYLQHQVWKPEHDPRGLGGDQINMALSSWYHLYVYLGEPRVLENMRMMADFWLDNGLSPAKAAWPHLPYPYNTELHSGVYDGDMRAGKGYLQPDKAASFGAELVVLYRITGEERYLESARRIAETLASKISPGTQDRSPWPFRVHALSGDIPQAQGSYDGSATSRDLAALYTANWTGALRLFGDLSDLDRSHGPRYREAFQVLSQWIKQYPMKNNNWGPFFEDIIEYSNTETNADTMAWYLLEHPEWDSDWRSLARGILDWSAGAFRDDTWAAYGLEAIREQTAYQVPGNSHTSRHASVELLYSEKTGDQTRKPSAIRQLSWATYMVDFDGKNRYPRDDIWLTDGYGDYVRHYLRAMASAPELAPSGQSHLLHSTTTVQQVSYEAGRIQYRTFSPSSRELLRVAFVPGSVTVDGISLDRLLTELELEKRPSGFTYEAPGDPSGILRIQHNAGREVVIARSSAIR